MLPSHKYTVTKLYCSFLHSQLRPTDVYVDIQIYTNFFSARISQCLSKNNILVTEKKTPRKGKAEIKFQH